jgi:HEAT repeat protein
MALTMQPLVDGKTAGNWLGGSETVTAEADSADETGFAEKGRGKDKSAEKVRARGALPDLIEAGILASHDPLVRLAHPALLGYLAAQGLASAAGRGGTQLVAQPEWSGKQAALSYLAVMDAQAAWMQNLLQDEQLDVTLSGLLSAGRWLRHAPDGLPWIPTVLRLLAGALQKETLPMALKTRIVTALALAKTSGIAVLLRQMSSASQPELRQLAALGLGIVKDAKALGDLLRLQHEPNPVVNRAAILALVAMGDKAGLEAVATQLLSGDESQRRAAAEGLANHPEDGHPTLEEAAGVTDPGVRRAAVYGLVRTRQGWAISLLEKLRAEDSQWIVQDAANQVLSALEGNNPRLPQALPDLTHTAWLLAFAAERGLAVAPGKPAVEMLYRSLKEGSEDQRMAAAYYLSRHPHADSLIPLYRMYFAERGELHERAWEAIWCQGAAGIQLPPPAQFDYR